MVGAEDLMQRLAVSKKIMERSEQIKSTSGLDTRKINMPIVEDFSPVNASYNLPSEYLPENEQTRTVSDPTQPLDEGRIRSSKLPDEIKRLMIDQPIVQPSGAGGSAGISEEVIQGAQRLMKLNPNKSLDNKDRVVNEQTNVVTEKQQTQNINMNEIKTMIRDVVRDTVRDVVREELKDAGMLVESTQEANEVIQFKVGQHLFIGKVTKIKKLEK